MQISGEEDEVAASLLADIMQLAKACEKASGDGYASHVLRARECGSLTELAQFRDGLIEELRLCREERRQALRLRWAPIRENIGVVASCIGVPLLVMFGIPTVIWAWFRYLDWLK
jgi:hypothetical protein